MPIRQGFEPQHTWAGRFSPFISGDLSGYGDGLFHPGASPVSGGRAFGSRLRGAVAASNGVARPGWYARNVGDDFYYRIYIKPRAIDLGNIVPPQVRHIEVWNAFLDSRTLSVVSALGDTTGLELAPSAPHTVRPLQILDMVLTAGQDTPPVVDVTYTLQWAHGWSATLKVVGVSVIAVPWPQLVPMQETLTWSTDVMTALDGTEQAHSLRDTPRQTYQVTLHPKDFSGAQHAFVGGYGRGFAVPSIDEGQPCAVAAGATEVLCNTTLGDWREMAMIWASEVDFEIVEIDEVLPDRLLLKRPISAARSGKVYPTATARLIADPRRTTFGFAGMIAATFEFSRTSDLAGPAAPTQWNGYDVLLQVPKLNPAEDTASQHIETLDNGTGLVSTDRYWNRAKVARPMRWVVTRAEMWPLRRWLHRRRGQWRPFYQPSFEPDFVAFGTGWVGTVLTVLANGYERYGKTKALAIRKTDGSYVFVDIQSLTTDGETTGLTIAPALDTLDYADIDRISLMGLKRLATDTVQIDHIGGGLHEVSADFLEWQ